MTRKEKFKTVWKKYESEAEEAKRSAKAAKEAHRKSDYDFWVFVYNESINKSEYFFNKYINA